jgi:hypothetical protein
MLDDSQVTADEVQHSRPFYQPATEAFEEAARQPGEVHRHPP